MITMELITMESWMTMLIRMNTKSKTILARFPCLVLGYWLLVASLVFPLVLVSHSSNAQQTEIVIGSETTPNQLPTMQNFTRSGGTFINNGASTSKGCSSGNFCTAGKQGPGGTYTSTFDLEENMTIDQINRGFTMDYGMDVDSHVSNVRATVLSCVGGNTSQAADCKDIFKLTVSLFDSGSVLAHQFEHEVELDFSGTRNFVFQQAIPENSFNSLTGEFAMFGIDAGFPNKFFGPAFANPALTTTFDLVTFIETEIIDILNTTNILDNNIPENVEVAEISVEVSTPAGNQVASLELQVSTEMEIETQLEMPTVEAPTVVEVEVAEVNTEIEMEMNNDLNDSVDAGDQSPTETETTQESGEVVSDGEGSEGQEPAVSEESVEPEEGNETESASVEQKNKPKVKTKVVKKQEAKQKAANKIVKRMGDKGKYDSTNQLKTLIVMQVLGNTKTFFANQTQLPDVPNFFSTDRVPDSEISDNNAAAYFMIGGSNEKMDELTGMQYR